MTVSQLFSRLRSLALQGKITKDSEVIIDSVFAQPLLGVTAADCDEVWLGSAEDDGEVIMESIGGLDGMSASLTDGKLLLRGKGDGE